MKWTAASLVATALSCACMMAEENVLDLESMSREAEAWAKENLNEDVLRYFGKGQREKVERFLTELRSEFQGEYVLDLAALRNTARTVLPLLEAHEETLGYAAWLRARMDYLEVADELRLGIPPPPVKPGQPPQPRPNPTAARQREVWKEKLVARPWPEEAKPYVSKLKPLFAANKVPQQLVWIAEVESSFDPRALSPAGAAGLFQIMPGTAKHYGLRTWPLDQRLKPETSAAVAARHLKYLHSKFGDWRLALAAYNSGEGTVQGLLKRFRTKEYDAIAPKLPAETQMYVPKVEAAILRREGRTLAEL